MLSKIEGWLVWLQIVGAVRARMVAQEKEISELRERAGSGNGPGEVDGDGRDGHKPTVDDYKGDGMRPETFGHSVGAPAYNSLVRNYNDVERELARVRDELFEVKRARDSWQLDANRYCQDKDYWQARYDKAQAELDELKNGVMHERRNANDGVAIDSPDRGCCDTGDTDSSMKQPPATPTGEPLIDGKTFDEWWLDKDAVLNVRAEIYHPVAAQVSYLRFQLAAANERADRAEASRMDAIKDLARYQTMVSRIRAAIKMAEEGKGDA